MDDIRFKVPPEQAYLIEQYQFKGQDSINRQCNEKTFEKMRLKGEGVAITEREWQYQAVLNEIFQKYWVHDN